MTNGRLESYFGLCTKFGKNEWLPVSGDGQETRGVRQTLTSDRRSKSIERSSPNKQKPGTKAGLPTSPKRSPQMRGMEG